MVALEVGCNGVGSLHLVGKNLKITDDVYLDMEKRVYEVDCRELYGGDFSFQQNNAPANCKKEVKEWLGKHMPKMLEPWPACGPDLTALNYAIWAILAGRVTDGVRENNIATEVGRQ